MTEIAEKRKAPPKIGIRHYMPAADLEVRQEGENGSVTFGGYAIRWDEPAEIRDFFGSFTEIWKRGSTAKTIAERGPQGNGAIKFQRGHPNAYFAGEFASPNAARFLGLIEDSAGLRFEAETIGTTVGRDLAAELQAGTVDTVSVGFDAIREEYDAEEERRTILEARLWEVSVVNWPAFGGSKIDSVRAFDRLPAYLDALLTEIREGKVLSNTNFARLTEARDLINGVIASAQPEPSDSSLEENALDVEMELALREREINLKG